MTPALDHVGLSVGDLDAQLAWYGLALGWRTASRFEIAAIGLRGAFLVSDDGQAVELLERRGASGGLRSPDPQAALLTLGFGHICIRVDDTDAWHARLLAAGARQRQAPGAAPEAGVRFSFVADPEGNLIEILDRPGTVDGAGTDDGAVRRADRGTDAERVRSEVRARTG
jgi:catechol 2,3-dioxygenase-like lactoylglutathione lyase family enzyme